MNENNFSKVLKFFIGLDVIFILCSIVLSEIALADDLEHIHVSWLIWQGQVPYTDFFEHHHPLMWYLFAPIVGMFNRNIMVFFIIRGIMSVVSFATLYVIYRIIKDFVADKITSLLAVCIFCASLTIQCVLVLFKPDLFMHLFYFLGVYYFFKFIRDEKQKDLNLSAVMFTIGFLFLQTIVFLVLPIGIVSIYLLIRKKLNFKMLIKAAIIPSIILGLAVAFMYFSGNLERYWQLNWVVNSQRFSETLERVKDFSRFYAILSLGTICAFYLVCKKPDIYVSMILLMFFSELLWRTLYLSTHIYYFKILLVYTAIVLSLVAVRIWKKRKIAAYVFVLFLFGFNMRFFLFEHTNISRTTEVLNGIMILTNNTRADEVIMGSSQVPLGVFNKAPHYYWFSWTYIGDIDERMYHYAPEFNINEILIEKRPRFVFFEDHVSNPGYVGGGKYNIDLNILYKYYDQVGNNLIYKRKMKI